MKNNDYDTDSMNPEPGPNVDANTRDENQHKPEQQHAEHEDDRVPATKGTDTPATTGSEYAERERGKRTTM